MRIPRYLFFIGLRYFFVKRKDHFVSFISAISIVGIALGVAVLITVLSIFNGFSKEIRAKILSINPHITLRSFNGPLNNWQNILEELKTLKDITGVAPYISEHGLLSFQGHSIPVGAIGIDAAQIDNIYPLANNITAGNLASLSRAGNFNLMLGQDLAEHLSINLNDEITLMTPKINVSPVSIMPRIKKFKITGIFKSNTPYDQHHIFLNILDAGILYKLNQGITGIQIKLKDELLAKQYAAKISAIFDHKYFVSDWTQNFNAFFEAMKMQKTVTWCVLLLIIAVAVFNLVSSLIMLVTDKRPDIAILRVMGASSKEIMLIFMIQGTFIGLIGTISGLIMGIILAYNITDLVNAIQELFHINFVSEELFMIGFVPSDIQSIDILWVCGLSLLMSMVATLYPAWRASNIKPAEALRYE